MVQAVRLTPHPSRPSRGIGASHLPLEGEGFGLSPFRLNAVQNREEPKICTVGADALIGPEPYGLHNVPGFGSIWGSTPTECTL